MIHTVTIFFVKEVRIVWEFVIPFFVVFFAIIIVLSMHRRMKYKAIFESFNNAEYEKLIPVATKFRNQQLHFSLVSNKNVILVLDSLSYVIAVSSLAINDVQTFLQHINDIRSQDMQVEKHYWLTIFYICQNAEIPSQHSYEDFQNCVETPNKRKQEALLLALFDYKKGKVKDAQAKVLEIKDEFSNPVAQKLIEDMLSGSL